MSNTNHPNGLADRSGTIALGGTAQVLMAKNGGRRGFWIQNLSAGDLYINETGAAAASAPSIRIASGALYESIRNACPQTAISIFGATTGQAFSAREWN